MDFLSVGQRDGGSRYPIERFQDAFCSWTGCGTLGIACIDAVQFSLLFGEAFPDDKFE